MRDRHGAVFWDMLMLQILAFHFTDTSGSPAYAGLALDSGHMPTRTTLKVYILVKSHDKAYNVNSKT